LLVKWVWIIICLFEFRYVVCGSDYPACTRPRLNRGSFDRPLSTYIRLKCAVGIYIIIINIFNEIDFILFSLHLGLSSINDVGRLTRRESFCKWIGIVILKFDNVFNLIVIFSNSVYLLFHRFFNSVFNFLWSCSWSFWFCWYFPKRCVWIPIASNLIIFSNWCISYTRIY